ncbi:unnamed protein product [Linum trigynum]|uniref:Uncharacterized protein n=1 Tax=Linum trigynum TaxID=586398 RepID=A0AAV2DFW4_9ROSI
MMLGQERTGKEEKRNAARPRKGRPAALSNLLAVTRSGWMRRRAGGVSQDEEGNGRGIRADDGWGFTGGRRSVGFQVPCTPIWVGLAAAEKIGEGDSRGWG